jgi:nitrate/TMAO reductase-like tetraheme cytochrome c subunit
MHMSPSRTYLRSLCLLLIVPWMAGLCHAEENDTCIVCHGALDPPYQVTSEQFSRDIHSQKGLSCAACHGGDPTRTDMDAMSKAAGFRGRIARSQIPALCGSCHSDADFMRKYNPSLRTDQLSQYRTSIHGKLFAKGDGKVAVCTDCHGVHDLRPAADAASNVNPLNIAKTCSRCHADADYMKEYSIPTDQFTKYNTSVHREALYFRGDLSAPTCTTCHGNHGAAPPGVETVQYVCSNCHVFQAQLYSKSPHQKAFHEADLPGCVTCHSNHAVLHPGDQNVGSGTEAYCTNCHVSGDAGNATAEKLHRNLAQLEASIKNSDQVLAQAESSGMEVSEARLELNQARDSLTKARVSVHSFQLGPVEQDIQNGLKVSARTMQAGNKALGEREFRRKGLTISLLFILATVLGLYLLIRQIEGIPREE